MRAYSIDLRERVVQAVEAGTSKAVVARTFQVSLATVKRYVALSEQTGNLTPKTSPGRTRRIRREADSALVAQLKAAPEATLQEHCETWQQSQGVSLSVSTMHRAIARVGWTRKKGRQ